MAQLILASGMAAAGVLAPVAVPLQGTAVAQSDPPPALQTRDGELSTVVLITSDADWLEKWNTPTSNIPQFKTASQLKAGQTATLLIFFSGLVPAEGRLKALCTIEIRKPNGVTDGLPESVCYDQMSLGQRKNVLLADARVEFKVEADDPEGLWLFRVVLWDPNSSSRTVSEVGVRLLGDGGDP
ncbi:hypothetical protein [Mesorhizobium sp. IMUNJ 23232]|uniref:hypothetical protein n=1 Tax=Mesorhizobium sp. IMUNJ 23232 TaxID=3376064 RepID=UPI0037955388